jgi:hypothetical protein
LHRVEEFGYPLYMGDKELGDDGMKRITNERTVVKEGTATRYCPLPIVDVRIYDGSG